MRNASGTRGIRLCSRGGTAQRGVEATTYRTASSPISNSRPTQACSGNPSPPVPLTGLARYRSGSSTPPRAEGARRARRGGGDQKDGGEAEERTRRGGRAELDDIVGDLRGDTPRPDGPCRGSQPTGGLGVQRKTRSCATASPSTSPAARPSTPPPPLARAQSGVETAGRFRTASVGTPGKADAASRRLCSRSPPRPSSATPPARLRRSGPSATRRDGPDARSPGGGLRLRPGGDRRLRPDDHDGVRPRSAPPQAKGPPVTRRKDPHPRSHHPAYPPKANAPRPARSPAPPRPCRSAEDARSANPAP